MGATIERPIDWLITSISDTLVLFPIILLYFMCDHMSMVRKFYIGLYPCYEHYACAGDTTPSLVLYLITYTPDTIVIYHSVSGTLPYQP